MKKLILFILLLSIAILAQDNKEIEIVKQTIIDSYVNGICNNVDETLINKGFHDGYSTLVIGGGNEMWKLPVYTWVERTKGGKTMGLYPVSSDRPVKVEFDFVDVSGTAAVAKLKFYEGDEYKFIDYFSLYKFQDGWKIVSKVFHQVAEE